MMFRSNTWRARVALLFASAFAVSCSGCSCDPRHEAADGGSCDALCDGGSLDASVATDAGTDGGRRDAAFPVDVDVAVDAALDVFCDAQAYGRCTAPWHCGCDARGEITGPPPSDVDACVVGGRTTCELALEGALRSGFMDGWTIDLDAADVCMRQRRQLFDECLPPGSNDDLPMACRDAVITNIPFGVPCPPGLRCAEGAGLCLDGVCRSLPATEGASCTTLCAIGLACVEGRCVPPVPPGGTCDSLDDCAGPDVCTGGVCGAPANEGEACTEDARCASGLVCRGGACVLEPATCLVRSGGGECGAGSFCGMLPPDYCAARRAEGQACSLDEECRTDLTCVGDATGATCVPVPTIGQRCVGRCADALRCIVDLATGSATCQQPLGAGQPCDRTAIGGSPCEDGLACVDGTCGAVPLEGQPCESDRICAAGLQCAVRDAGWICVARVGEGSACSPLTLGVDCLEGLWCDTGGVCRAPAREGQPCGECESGLDCRFDAALGRAICMVPHGEVGEECGGVCTGELYCDTHAGSCVPSICEQWFPGRYR